MSIWSCKLMKENELSKPVKCIVALGLMLVVAIGAVGAVQNAMHGVVSQPSSFVIVLIGFACFIFAKLPIVLHKRRVTFGAGLMSEDQANLYRVGYYLMGLGFILTFA